jgi:hypothetical protein
MPRDFRLYIDDILEAIQQIRTYMEDLDEEAFAHRAARLEGGELLNRELAYSGFLPEEAFYSSRLPACIGIGGK